MIALIVWLAGSPVEIGQFTDWTACVTVMDTLEESAIEASCHAEPKPLAPETSPRPKRNPIYGGQP